jgi:hypothetical protein
MAIFVNFKEQKFQENINRLNDVWIPSLHQMFGEYEFLELPPLTSIEDLVKLLSDPKSFVVDQVMAGTNYNLSGFPFDKQKLRDLVELPKGFPRLEKLVEGMGKMFSHQTFYVKPEKPSDLIAFFDLDSAGVITIKESKVLEIKKKNSVYLESPEAEALYQAGQEILEIINSRNLEKIIKARYPQADGLGRFFNELLISSFEHEPAKLKMDVLKGFDVTFK